jgi:hypothetical protein
MSTFLDLYAPLRGAEDQEFQKDRWPELSRKEPRGRCIAPAVFPERST